MKTLRIQDRRYTVDEEGYLATPDQRDDAWVRHVQETEGIPELTEEHQIVLREVERYHTQHGVVPMAREISRATGLKIQRIHELFPSGPGPCVCKMLGLSPADGLQPGGRLPRWEADRTQAHARAEAIRIEEALKAAPVRRSPEADAARAQRRAEARELAKEEVRENAISERARSTNPGSGGL